jgi:signal transduction histidine kinase
VVAQKQSAPPPLQGQPYLDSMVREDNSPNYKSREDTNKVQLLYQIAFRYRISNPDEELQYGAKALELAQKLNWAKGIGDAYFSLGLNYLSKSDYEKTNEYWKIALKYYKDQGNKKGILNISNNLGVVKYEQGDIPGALENWLTALTMAEELGDVKQLGAIYANLGGLYSELGNEQKSLEYSIRSLAYAKLSGKKELIANSLGSVGNKYYFLKQYDSALAYFLPALRIFEELGDKHGTARILLNLSLVSMGRNIHKDGLELAMKSLKIFSEVENRSGIASASTTIGQIYLSAAADSNLHSLGVAKMKMPIDEAVGGGSDKRTSLLVAADSFLSKAIVIFIELESIDELKGCYASLSEAKAMMGDFKGALENYKQYTFYKDSVYSTATNVKIANLGAKRELELKETRIKLLSQENNLKDLRAAKDKQTRRALLGGIGMLVVLACSLVLYYVRKQKSDKLIANERINTLLKEQELQSVSSMLEVQEQERKRIAADLHDRLGSMLSTVKLYFNTVEEQIDALKEQNKEQYHKATTLLDEACDEVRKISHNLVSGELVKFGLVSALHQLKETIEDSGKMKMNVLAFGMEDRLGSNTEISLYRVIQELMNNMLKHAKATEVTIQLNRVEHNLNIVVEDNGIGFDVEAAMAKDGMGLRNIETRVKKLNGVTTFDSGKGRGTTTIIDIPV